jgi:glucose-6-phosphate isomerase
MRPLTSSDEDKWLGWLIIADDQLAHRHKLAAAAADARGGGFSHILLLGMGGSSLCPEVLKMTFGTIPGYPELHVLDSTDPAQIQAMEEKVDLARTLFLVSSKSGSTLEQIFSTIFFRASKADPRRRENRVPIHRYHRPRFEDGVSGPG